MILHHSLAWWLVQLLRLGAAWMAAAILFALAWIQWEPFREAVDRRRGAR